MSASAEKCWIVDRKISLGLILAIAVHVIAVTTWLVRLDSRVGQLERTDVKHDVGLDSVSCVKSDIEVMKNDLAWIKDAMQGTLHAYVPSARKGQKQ